MTPYRGMLIVTCTVAVAGCRKLAAGDSPAEEHVDRGRVIIAAESPKLASVSTVEVGSTPPDTAQFGGRLVHQLRVAIRQ